MRPLTVVTLIILGTCFSIMFSLAAVLIVVLFLGDEYPRLQSEFDPLLKSFLLFTVMTLISVASFYALLKKSHGSLLGAGLLVAGIAAYG